MLAHGSGHVSEDHPLPAQLLVHLMPDHLTVEQRQSTRCPLVHIQSAPHRFRHVNEFATSGR